MDKLDPYKVAKILAEIDVNVSEIKRDIKSLQATRMEYRNLHNLIITIAVAVLAVILCAGPELRSWVETARGCGH